MQLPTPGSTFQGFEIISELGKGGFATVFRATDSSGKPVALKILSPDEDDGYSPGTRARFAREVSILARLRDPHTVQLLAHGEATDGALFMAFELLPGRDLSEHLAITGRLPPEDVIAILRQALESLREAHDLGLVHRDLKPQNIRLISDVGAGPMVKLLDFGIARSTGPGPVAVTKTGELVGTPRYMSPEQLTGRPLTAASDIYGLGMVAFEMIMGSDALAGNRLLDQIGRMRTGHLLSMPDLESGNGELLAIVQKMTSRNVEDRFSDARAVLAAIDKLEAGVTSVRHPAASPEHTQPWRWIALVVVAAGALGAGALYLAAPRPDPVVVRPGPSTRANDLIRTRAADAEAIAPDVAVPVDVSMPANGTKGCGKPVPFRGLGRLDGLRSYVPANYDASHAHPLIILARSSAEAEPRESGFGAIADRDGVIIVAPAGDTWGGSDSPEMVLDHAYESVSDHLCVDTQRVFVFGHYKGGRAGLVAACLPWVTAAGWSSYLPSEAFPENKGRSAYWCETAKPLIIFTPTALPEEDKPCLLVRKTMTLGEVETMLGRRNGVSQVRTEVDVGAGATCWVSDGGARLQSCRVEGGSLWPGMDSPENLLCGKQRVSEHAVAETAWAFFDVSDGDAER